MVKKTETPKKTSAPKTGSAQTALEPSASAEALLSPAQKSFKQLVERIELVENRINELTALLDDYRPVFAKKLLPLREERVRLGREMVLLLDAALMRKRWTANQRDGMLEIMLTFAESLLGTVHEAEMRAVLDRHGAAEVEIPMVTNRDTLAEEMEALLGVNLRTTTNADGTASVRTDEEIFEEAHRLVEEQEQRRRDEQAASAAKRGAKKSAKQSKAELQAVDADKMLKDIYRRLTSVLHPDREPDPAARTRKTALMSEANKAYESKNLMKLLQLQLQASHLDARVAMAFADDRLQLVNRSLKEQLDDLKMECLQIEALVREEFDLPDQSAANAAALDRSLKRKAADTSRFNKMLRSDLGFVKRGDQCLKIWLQEQLQLQREQMRQDEMFEKAMMAGTRRR